MALSSSSLHGKTGEEPSGAGGGRFGRSGPRRRPGVEGKRGGGSAGSIPGRNSARGVLRWLGHSGRRRRVVAAQDWQSRGRRRSREGGGAPVGLRGAQAYLDSGRGAVERGLPGGRRSGAAAMANGGARMSGRRLRSSGLGMWCGGAAPGPL